MDHRRRAAAYASRGGRSGAPGDPQIARASHWREIAAIYQRPQEGSGAWLAVCRGDGSADGCAHRPDTERTRRDVNGPMGPGAKGPGRPFTLRRDAAPVSRGWLKNYGRALVSGRVRCESEGGAA